MGKTLGRSEGSHIFLPLSASSGATRFVCLWEGGEEEKSGGDDMNLGESFTRGHE